MDEVERDGDDGRPAPRPQCTGQDHGELNVVLPGLHVLGAVLVAVYHHSKARNKLQSRGKTHCVIARSKTVLVAVYHHSQTRNKLQSGKKTLSDSKDNLDKNVYLQKLEITLLILFHVTNAFTPTEMFNKVVCVTK